MAFGQSGRLSHISTPAVHDITSDPYHRLETPKGRWTRLSPFTDENEEVQGAGRGDGWAGEAGRLPHEEPSLCSLEKGPKPGSGRHLAVRSVRPAGGQQSSKQTSQGKVN